MIRRSIAESDAARPALTMEEQAELADYDRWVAQLAAQDEPLDGCEEKPETPRVSLLGWWNAAVAA